jgi:hypothetical protein
MMSMGMYPHDLYSDNEPYARIKEVCGREARIAVSDGIQEIILNRLRSGLEEEMWSRK